MRLKCSRPDHRAPKPIYLPWSYMELPVFRCPDCGGYSQSEISLAVTQSTKRGSYDKATELALRS